MRKISLFCCFIVSLACGGCAQRELEPQLSQLQVREIQSRDFDTRDTKLVMKTMMDVLQDEGFVIKNAVSDLGLLSAEKIIDIENKRFARMALMFGGHEPRWEKQQILEISANVSEYGDKIRVRVNFQTKNVDNYGRPTDVRTVLDPDRYQAFFEKVSKGIFLQQENI